MFATTPLELVANISFAISVWLAARNSPHTWWVGLLGCGLFAWLFFSSQLYADVTLQLFFIVTSLLGWWQWLRGHAGSALPVRRSKPQFIALRVALALLVALAYGTLLHYFTNAYAPYIDSLVLTFSVLAQLLLVQRRIENWPCWLVVNSISIPLYLSRGLTLTAIFYLLYWCNVLYGLYCWRRELQCVNVRS
ncbi:nicotinamide riboside transporter PnuC [Iodobacter sp.]|uniref:nicotinamide riboside transporter PnuC n=1 Tax=Iodobacter sp. TaxID=1915058 RepID=UPI0025E60218|nr:nicotinamide riboside transporter PnuC [Iodobacter sp.]